MPRGSETYRSLGKALVCISILPADRSGHAASSGFPRCACFAPACAETSSTTGGGGYVNAGNRYFVDSELMLVAVTMDEEHRVNVLPDPFGDIDLFVAAILEPWSL